MDFDRVADRHYSATSEKSRRPALAGLRYILHTAGLTSVLLKSRPLNNKGSPATLARA
jgi:hypothetical protein